MKTFLFGVVAVAALTMMPLAMRADGVCLKKGVTIELRSADSSVVLIDSVRRIELSVSVDDTGEGIGTLTLDPNTYTKDGSSSAVAVHPIRVRVKLVKDDNHTAKGRRVYRLTEATVADDLPADIDRRWLLVMPLKDGSSGSLVFLDGKGKVRDVVTLDPVPTRGIRKLEVWADDFQRSKAARPQLVGIDSPDDLAKATVFRDDDGRDAVAKHIDFSKEKLVVFVWKGSNTDTITEWPLTPGSITFVFKAGYGEDMPHAKVVAFAVPKDTPVAMRVARVLKESEER